jgi:hypothetical protein
MYENGMGYMNHPEVAGRIGHAMAQSIMREGRDDVVEHERQGRRQRRARVARAMRAFAARFAPVDADAVGKQGQVMVEHRG